MRVPLTDPLIECLHIDPYPSKPHLHSLHLFHRQIYLKLLAVGPQTKELNLYEDPMAVGRCPPSMMELIPTGGGELAVIGSLQRYESI